MRRRLPRSTLRLISSRAGLTIDIKARLAAGPAVLFPFALPAYPENSHYSLPEQHLTPPVLEVGLGLKKGYSPLDVAAAERVASGEGGAELSAPVDFGSGAVGGASARMVA